MDFVFNEGKDDVAAIAEAESGSRKREAKVMAREAIAMANEAESIAREAKIRADAISGNGFDGIDEPIGDEHVGQESELMANESGKKACYSEAVAREYETIFLASFAGAGAVEKKRNAKGVSRICVSEAKARQSEAWARLWESWARQSEYSARQSEAFETEMRDFKNFVRKCLTENEDKAGANVAEEEFKTVAFDAAALTRESEALACHSKALARESEAMLQEIETKTKMNMDEAKIQEVEEKSRIRVAEAKERQFKAWVRQSDAIARQSKAIDRQTQYKVTADEFDALTRVYLSKAEAKAKAAAEADEAASSVGQTSPALESFFASSQFKANAAKSTKADTKARVYAAEKDEINNKKAKKAKSRKGFCVLS